MAPLLADFVAADRGDLVRERGRGQAIGDRARLCQRPREADSKYLDADAF
jgi:hypothetical protein